jgi:hypothetical protein
MDKLESIATKAGWSPETGVDPLTYLDQYVGFGSDVEFVGLALLLSFYGLLMVSFGYFLGKL